MGAELKVCVRCRLKARPPRRRFGEGGWEEEEEEEEQKTKKKKTKTKTKTKTTAKKRTSNRTSRCQTSP